jgi:hypothetical protein
MANVDALNNLWQGLQYCGGPVEQFLFNQNG